MRKTEKMLKVKSTSKPKIKTNIKTGETSGERTEENQQQNHLTAKYAKCAMEEEKSSPQTTLIELIYTDKPNLGQPKAKGQRPKAKSQLLCAVIRIDVHVLSREIAG